MRRYRNVGRLDKDTAYDEVYSCRCAGPSESHSTNGLAGSSTNSGSASQPSRTRADILRTRPCGGIVVEQSRQISRKPCGISETPVRYRGFHTNLRLDVQNLRSRSYGLRSGDGIMVQDHHLA